MVRTIGTSRHIHVCVSSCSQAFPLASFVGICVGMASRHRKALPAGRTRTCSFDGGGGPILALAPTGLALPEAVLYL